MRLKNNTKNRQHERRNICYMSAPQVSETKVLWYMRCWLE